MAINVRVNRHAEPLVRVSLLLLLSVVAPPAVATQGGDGEQVERRTVHVVRGSGDDPIVMMQGLPVSRTYLGVHLINLTPELMAHFGVAEEDGVMVSQVADDSPAATADLRVGDILTAVDGRPIRSAGQLAREIASRREGDLVTLQIWRDGALQTLTATLAARQRHQLDIRPFLWHGEDDGHGDRLVIPGEGLEEHFEIDSETLDDALDTLRRQFDSDQLQNRMRYFREHGDGLLERLERLEQRLDSLERELEKLPADDS